MKIDLPEPVRRILGTCRARGHTAYAVGGCVRDSLLGRTPEDWDIATSARPEEIKAIFSRTIDTGLSHGTVTVREEGRSFEVTTFRVDGEYDDCRHPKSVAFTDSIEEDLSRRDFTVNAMAYSEERGLIDPFGGQRDLAERAICCVGEPDVRFAEDALRMLRALRFSAQLGFCVHPETLRAIRRQAARIRAVSAERVRDELTKTVCADCAGALSQMYGTGLMDILLPELALCFRTPQNIKYHLYDVGTHTLLAAANTLPEPVLRFAALFHDLGKPEKRTSDPDGTTHFKGHAEVSAHLSADVMRRLRFSNREADQILRLVRFHDREIVLTKKAVKHAVRDVGEDIFLKLLELKRADAMGQNLHWSRPRLALYDEIERIYRDCRAEQEAFSLRELAVDGHDVMALGYRGRAVGFLLNRLLEHVLERPEDNLRPLLLKILEKNADLWLNERKEGYIIT